MSKLTALKVEKTKTKGLYADGGNLYLQVGADGSKSWIFRYRLNEKSRYMGLGAYPEVPLATDHKKAPDITGAREKAAECRRLVKSGIDPIDARKKVQAAEQLAAAKTITFEQCAAAYIESHKAGWKNAKHIWQWENSLERFVYPTFGKLPVQDIDITLVMKALEPIWTTKTETATRVRGRIESILDWACVRGYREGENPARWRGRLENLLPSPTKIKKVKHQPALPYQKIYPFMQSLNEQTAIAATALKLVIYTATRTSEALKAEWKEFDLDKGIWTIPAERTKQGKEHRVPLSPPALSLMKKLKEQQQNEWVFAGSRYKPVSNMVMLMLLRRMGHKDITVHGFRSTFRDWAAEQTNYAWDVAEAALSHKVGNTVEASYMRSDLFEKRRLLMKAWSEYCNTPMGKGKVLKLHG